MKKIFLLIFLMLFLNQISSQTWYQSSFAKDGLNGWSAADEWRSDSGLVVIETDNSSEILKNDYLIYGSRKYNVEVELKGDRAGIIFGMINKDSKFLSHMVSFNKDSLLLGYFTPARDFTATSIVTLENPPTDWTTLRIEVSPEEERYSVYVNEQLAGDEEILIFPAGYIGLLGSDGQSEFRSVKIFGTGSNKKPSLPAENSEVSFYNLKYVKKSGSNLIVYDELIDSCQVIDHNGLIVGKKSIEEKPALQKEVKVAGKIYKISERKIIVTDAAGNRKFEIDEKLSDPASLLTDGKVIFVSDPGTAKILMFSLDGKFKKSFQASSIGGLLYPQGIDFFDKNFILLADVNKIIFVPRDFNENEPIVIESNTGDVIIQWESASSGNPSVEISTDEKNWNRFSGKRIPGTFMNEVELKNLESETEYYYKIYPTLHFIPNAAVNRSVLKFKTGLLRSTYEIRQ